MLEQKPHNTNAAGVCVLECAYAATCCVPAPTSEARRIIPAIKSDQECFLL